MTSRANYDGLTRLQVAGTWSPQPSTFPIVLDKEIRGGLRYCSGTDGDTLTNIPGAMLQEGMLVWLENTTGTFTGGNYYQYNLLADESRNTTSGAMPNANGNWTRFQGGGGGVVDVTGVADVEALNDLADDLDADNDGDLVQLLDSTDFNDPDETDPDVTGIPDPLPFTPGAAVAVILRWSQEGTTAGSWQYQRFVRNDPDAAYVLEVGDTMTGNLLFNDGTANTAINVDGSAVFNENGDDVDFRVEGTGQANALFVDGENGRVGINEGDPDQPLDVNGNVTVDGTIRIEDGNGLILQNADENQTITINADDAEASYTVTLPPTAPTADGQVLAVASGTTDAELQWAAPVPLEAYTAITTAWDLDDDLMVRINANDTTVPIPTNQRDGQTGLLLLNAGITGLAWPDAGGDVFQYAGGAVPNITQFPAIIPYTVITGGTNDDRNNGVILWGSPTANIT